MRHIQRAWHRLARLGRFWQSFDWAEATGGFAAARRFLRDQLADGCVLLVEPNQYHAEVLPGYCSYFRQLGFRAVVLTRRTNSLSGVFDRMPENERPAIYAMRPWLMRWLLRQSQAQEFEFTLITSSHIGDPHGYWGLYLDYFGFTPTGKLGYAVVVHDLEHMAPHLEAGRVPVDRCIVLTGHNYGGRSVRMVNPHYFGRTGASGRPKVRRTFISVGTVSAYNRGFGTMIDAMRDLLSEGYEDFEVRVIGRSGATRADHPDAPANMTFLGDVDFVRLFEEMEQADFYLALLDPGNAGHRRYLDRSTTGSRQLCLGFEVLPVIEQEFARTYGMDETSAIVYSCNDLLGGIRRAIQMAPDEYERRRSALRQHAVSVAEESLKNLRAIVFEGERQSAQSRAPGQTHGTSPSKGRVVLFP